MQTATNLFETTYDINHLQINDTLVTVDDKDVYRYRNDTFEEFFYIHEISDHILSRWPIVQLAPLLLGPEGSIVCLGVEVLYFLIELFFESLPNQIDC